MLVSSKQDKESQCHQSTGLDLHFSQGPAGQLQGPKASPARSRRERETVSKEEKHYFGVTHFLHTRSTWSVAPPNASRPHCPPLQQQGESMPGHPGHPNLFLFDKSWQGMLYAEPHKKKTREGRTKPPAEAAQDSQHPPCCPLTQSAPKPSLLRHEAKTA